ncbi:MAG: WxcM-like domain-containing protein [Chitinophagaceae bacterium]|nr:WxcM-like domain-containing protein [Chitinophagaceae bacterium]
MKAKFTIHDCALLNLSQLGDRHGHLTIIENEQDVPFEIKRVYYLYDIPGGESRGGHGHIHLESLIVAVSGSFDVTVDDGHERKTISLNRPYHGLHIKPGMWRELHNFSSGAVCLVLASELYNEEDYIRNYQQYLELSHS